MQIQSTVMKVAVLFLFSFCGLFYYLFLTRLEISEYALNSKNQAKNWGFNV